MEDITPADSVVPVYLIPLTDDELAQREQLLLEQIKQDSEKAEKLSIKETAISKLTSLGLTEEEVLAIIGE